MAQLSSTSGKQALDDLLQSSVDSREVPAVFFGVTNAEETLYLNCAGEKHFGDESKGQVDEDTSESKVGAFQTGDTVGKEE
jgi:hypothetical protein